MNINKIWTKEKQQYICEIGTQGYKILSMLELGCETN